MADEKRNWDDIPSIADLEVDWTYEPENPLGKRAYLRLSNEILHDLLDVTKIPVKIVTANLNINNLLLDLSENGLAVLSNHKFTVGNPVKVGLILQMEKVVSRAIVRNVTSIDSHYRIGMEFVGLDEKSVSFIKSLIASQAQQL